MKEIGNVANYLRLMGQAYTSGDNKVKKAF